MKKIINGRIFDTEKAVLVGEVEASCGHGDFNWWKAGLYQTPVSKRFFISGEGGAMTMFSRTISQNEWSGGSKVIPMDNDEALAWAEQYLNTEVIEKYFADLIKEA